MTQTRISGDWRDFQNPKWWTAASRCSCYLDLLLSRHTWWPQRHDEPTGSANEIARLILIIPLVHGWVENCLRSTSKTKTKLLTFSLEFGMLSRAWRRLRLLTFIACFPTPGAICMPVLSRVWYLFHIFPGLAPCAFFPRLALVPCFPALDTCCVHVFPRSWHQAHSRTSS